MALASTVQVGNHLARSAACIQLAEPDGDIGVGVVRLRLLLHVHNHNGNIQVAYGREHVVAGCVGEHLKDYQVNVGSAEDIACILSLLLGGYHTAVDKLDRGGERFLECSVLRLELGYQLRELRQVRAECDGEYTDFCLGVYEHSCLLGHGTCCFVSDEPILSAVRRLSGIFAKQEYNVMLALANSCFEILDVRFGAPAQWKWSMRLFIAQRTR